MSIFLHHASKRFCTAANRSLHTSTAVLAGNKFSLGLDTSALDPEGLGLNETKPFKKRRVRGYEPNTYEKQQDNRNTNTRGASDTRYEGRPRTNDRSNDRQPRDGGPYNARNRENSRDGGKFRDNRDRDRPRTGFAPNKDGSPRSRAPRDASKSAGTAQEDPPDVLAGLSDTLGDIDQDDTDLGRTRDRTFQRRGKPQPTKSGYEERRKREEQEKEPVKATSLKPRKAKLQQVERKIAIPSITSVSNLATLLGTKLRRLQFLMEKVGMTDNRPDRVVTSDDASLIALEMGYDPVVDNEKAFDIYPDPPATDHATLPLRPPIVTIMGHVDHGKTTLLDTLRSTEVAASEAGGITQHIGAFEVSIDVLLGDKADKATTSSAKTITFLDTPGHAAFSAMRSRGRGVTDIVVIVVAADDGVMSQTREVIDLVKDGEGGVDPSVGVVIAITKCDKPGADAVKAKESIMAAGLTIEEFGGEIPCIEVSAVSKEGLPELVEMINVLAEVRDLRAEREKVRMEGRVIESRVEKGRGNVATVLVLRGNLTPSTNIVAGTTWCRVRQLMPSVGTALKIAYPGQPVEITGWKALPSAGDEVLQTESEDEAKKVIAARQERQEQLTLMGDVEIINEKRRIEAEQETARKEAEEAAKNSKSIASSEVDETPKEPEMKELRLIIKADVSGSVEAVVGCLESIGNKEAKVKIVSSSVGDVSEADLNQAKASEAVIVAFNVKAPRSIQTQANGLGIQILNNGVIYRLIEEVTARVVGLLPPIIDSRVVGEGSILQIFNTTIKGRQTKAIAGCRVTNGTFSRAAKVRILRDKNIIYSGSLDTFKQGKNDATSVAKGAECGVSFDNFEDFRAGDAIQMYEEFEVKRQL